MADLSRMKLGKLPARHDPRTLRLADYLNPAALPPIPVKRAWDDGFAGWQMLGNDRAGDCVEAAVAHGQQVFAVNNGRQFAVTDAQVLAFYATLTGYNPVTGANDNGSNILDAIKAWRSGGFLGHAIGAFASVDPTNAPLMQAAIDLFGFVMIGVLLPLSAQQQSGPTGLWDVPPGGPTGNGAPGSWGGHCVILPDYDSGYTAITWGYLQPASQAFLHTYCDEAYAILSPDWFGPNAQAPSGFDLAALTADLALVSGQQPSPTPTPTPPPWQPDPALLAAFAWQTSAAGIAQQQYSAGNARGALGVEQTMAGYATQVATYLAGEIPTLQAPPLLHGW